MPNQNYFEAREELRMAQCDLSLSYPTCKTEERLCKYAYSSWCPTCDKESPRRRSKSETNEPCRRKGREMKGTPKKHDWNQECENMELEYEAKDIRYDNCRVRSNLCELPTTYITNNCQMLKLSNCPSDFIDTTEKGIKCYENSLKSGDFNNQFQNFGTMSDRQDRIYKLFPRLEETTRNINGIVNKINSKSGTTKHHIHTFKSASAPLPTEIEKLYVNLKHSLKSPDGKKLKPVNGSTVSHNFQNLSSRNNELYNLELRNKQIRECVQDHNCGDFRTSPDPCVQFSLPKSPLIASSSGPKSPLSASKSTLSAPKSPLPVSKSPYSKSSPNCKVVDMKFHDLSNSSNICYETCTFFNKKIDVDNLKQLYTREVELLKEKLRDLKNSNDNHPKTAPASAQRESHLKLPPMPEVRKAAEIEMDFKRVCHTNDIPIRRINDTTLGAVPKVPVVEHKQVEPESVASSSLSSIQSKRDRLMKTTSKVSLKTKAKVGTTKLRKQRTKATSIVVTSSEASDSDCSGSEDSDKESNLDDSESLDDASSTSSLKEIASFIATKHVKSGAGDASTIKWPLRHSLFPYIPPYLCFVCHNVNPQKVPTGSRYMKWKMSTITPVLVRKTLTNSGFRLVRSEFTRDYSVESNEWIGTWGKHMKSPMFKTLKEAQKLNHFPGTFQVGRKDRLWRNLQKLMYKHGAREFGFIPQTYVLPQDLKLLKQHWQNKNGGGNEKYIIKPPASARGTGIKVINRWSQLPKRMSLVVQEYISNPYLINGSKFDLRLYVLVTSFDPLRIYLYPDGLARFASVPYSDDAKDLKDRYMHLTNYSINKMSSLYTANEDANSCKGHKWTLSKLWEYMEKRGIDTKALWRNLQQLVIKTLISGESSIVPLCRENLNSRYNCYELFGVDVLLDEHLKCWLLEVNISPSLHSQSPLDEYVKGPMVQCLFELAQFHLPPRLGRIENKNTPACFDPRIYATTLTKKERNKHNYFCQTESRQEYLEDILAQLTGDDVRHLTQAEDELVVIGQFEKIFPTAHTHKYLEFMEARYYNRLFDAWECKYEKNRQPGIRALQMLCETKMHLKVAPPTVLTKSSQSSTPGDQNLQPSKEGQTDPTPSDVTVVSPPLTQPNAAADVGILSSNKQRMDIQSLYNALRLESEKVSMALRPFPYSDFATHV